MKSTMLLVLLACGSALAAQRRPGSILVINEDNDHYFYPGGDRLTEKGVRAYFDEMADGGAVTHFFMCVNGQRASYDSKVFEPIWMGIGERDEWGRTNNPWCVNAKILHARGIDVWKIWCARAREKGISPWISMRMNDGHHISNKWKAHRNETYWWEHPELWRDPDSRGKKGGVALQAFDYSKPEVRARSLALVREILDRWDADGIEIDWMRQRYNLTPGKVREQAPLLTGFMREVRKACNAAAAKRGRPVKVAVRVQTTLFASEHVGFDVLAWAREGLVDVVVPSPEWAVTDFDMDVPGWKKALNEVNPSVALYPCTDIGMYGSKGVFFEIYRDLAVLRGWAANAAPGSDGLYLFNAIYYREPQRSAVYGGALQPDRLIRARRRFPVTFHDGLPRRLDGRQIPCELKKGAQVLVNATPGPYDAGARVVIAVKTPGEGMPEITLNGVRPISSSRLPTGKVFPTKPKTECEAFAWYFPASAVRTGKNAVRTVRADGTPRTAVWCEIELWTKETESEVGK